MALNNFRKCKSCGSIFNFMGKPMCPNCIKKMDEDFAKVRKYIYENPNARAEEISEETGVDTKTIMQFLREGRLELRVADGSILCEKCGVPISSGRLCPTCSQNISNNMSSVLPKAPEPKKHQQELTGLKSKLHVNVAKGKEE